MRNKFKRTLSASALKLLEPGQAAWDNTVGGYHGRRNGDGTITLRLKTRVRGRQRIVTIGRLGSPWTLESGRKEAIRMLLDARLGNEPRPDRLRDREKPKTVKEAVDAFFEGYGTRLKPRSKEEYERLLTLHFLPRFGTRLIDSISHSDAVSLHETLGATRKRTANHVIAVISKLMAWCEAKGWRDKDSNPCRGVVRFAETKRNRYLTSDESKRLGDVLRKLEAEGRESPYAIAAIWLIIFTGARRDEILTMKWAFVDKERCVINLPDSKTGPRSLVLNKHAMDILNGIPRVRGNPFVIIGHREGHHLVNIAKPWGRIRKEARLAGLRLHDLRHSFGNKAIDAGGSTRILMTLFGHAREDMTLRYAHVSDSRASRLAEATGDLIASSMASPRPQKKLRGGFVIRRHKPKALPRMKGRLGPLEA